MDKAEKKRLQQEFREKEKQSFVDSLPMSAQLFDELFDSLNEKLEEEGCDHTLNITIKFLEGKGISTSNVVEWLREHGAGCDCEVIFNVEEYF